MPPREPRPRQRFPVRLLQLGRQLPAVLPFPVQFSGQPVNISADAVNISARPVNLTVQSLPFGGMVGTFAR
jgi:hypothetical protein